MPRRARASSRPANRPNKKPLNRRRLLIGGIALVAVLVAGVLIVSSLNAPRFGGVPVPNRLTMGSPDAPVLVEEFSDFQCPYCAKFFREQEPQILTKYIETGQAQLTYVPFSFIGPESVAAAEAAYCAADQNKFWDYHFVLFNAQGAENSGIYSDVKLQNYASKAGLDVQQFLSCYQANTYKQQVENDVKMGEARGVTGTPTFFVNGKGPFSGEEVLAEIEKALP